MKNKTKGEMITAYQRMVDRMKLLALRLKHHQLDNKCSAKFKECITKNRMTHKLVLSDCHCPNIAEGAIQTFKNLFVSILSGVDDRFPLSLWCHLVQPVELTINLLQQSNAAPKVSTYAHVHGQHDYMKHPFASLGCALMAHVKPRTNKPGTYTQTPASTSGRQWSITNISTSTLLKPGQRELATQCSSNINT